MKTPMKTLEQLHQELTAVMSENSERQAEIENQIKVIHVKQFEDWKALQDAIDVLGSYKGVDYCFTEYGDLCSYVSFDVSDLDPLELEHLEDYVSGFGFYLNTKNGIMENLQGDCITIQDDTRRDNGVWDGQKLIIDESDYLDDDGCVDEVKRNALIEEHMEKTGYSPGVFRVTRDGDVYPVDTTAKGE